MGRGGAGGGGREGKKRQARRGDLSSLSDITATAKFSHSRKSAVSSKCINSRDCPPRGVDVTVLRAFSVPILFTNALSSRIRFNLADERSPTLLRAQPNVGASSIRRNA